jgi:hypothetical protein
MRHHGRQGPPNQETRRPNRRRAITQPYRAPRRRTRGAAPQSRTIETTVGEQEDPPPPTNVPWLYRLTTTANNQTAHQPQGKGQHATRTKNRHRRPPEPPYHLQHARVHHQDAIDQVFEEGAATPLRERPKRLHPHPQERDQVSPRKKAACHLKGAPPPRVERRHAPKDSSPTSGATDLSANDPPPITLAADLT